MKKKFLIISVFAMIFIFSFFSFNISDNVKKTDITLKNLIALSSANGESDNPCCCYQISEKECCLYIKIGYGGVTTIIHYLGIKC